MSATPPSRAICAIVSERGRRSPAVSRGSLMIARLLLALAILAVSLPAAGQGLLRTQTNRAQDAIQNQIRQAVKPVLRVRNAAGEVDALALSPDGRYLAIVLADDTARLWDLRGGLETLRLRSDAGRFRAVRISADNRLIATGGDSGTVTLWDAAS